MTEAQDDGDDKRQRVYPFTRASYSESTRNTTYLQSVTLVMVIRCATGDFNQEPNNCDDVTNGSHQLILIHNFYNDINVNVNSTQQTLNLYISVTRR